MTPNPEAEERGGAPARAKKGQRPSRILKNTRPGGRQERSGLCWVLGLGAGVRSSHLWPVPSSTGPGEAGAFLVIRYLTTRDTGPLPRTSSGIRGGCAQHRRFFAFGASAE